MGLKARIIEVISDVGPLDDDEIAIRIGARRQVINQAARQLAQSGEIWRGPGASGKIVNRLADAMQPVPDQQPALSDQEPAQPAMGRPLVSEDEVKEAVRLYLERSGYKVVVAWGRTRGIDIDAAKDGDRIVIEAKGEVANPPQQVNYFLGALGELVQRMNDPFARFGLALPDNRQYQGLASRLPALARQRLRLTFYFVKGNGDAWHVSEEGPPVEP